MTAVLLIALTAVHAWAAPAFPRAKAVPQRLLVGVRPSVKAAQIGSLQVETRAKATKLLAGGRVLVLDFPADADMVEMYSRVRAIPGVEFVEPDLMMYPTLIPNDPDYGQQYHWPLIRAPEGWDVATGGSDVVIAFVDTGCDLDHPDLVGRIYTNPGEIPDNGVDDDGNGFVDDVHGWDFQNNNNDPNPNPDGVDNDGNGEPDDQVKHGTLTAGIACATGNDAWGVAGMNWGAKILPIQVFPDDGGGSVSTVIEGIDYAVAMGADIINLSLGGGYAQSFTPAIANARSHGILVVSAAGNSGRQLTDDQSTWESPVCNDGVLGVDNNVFGVGATDQNDRIASFSNFDGSTARNFVECCAPGQAIYGPAYYDPTYAHLSEYFYTNTGTSFAAPMVSGLAAILMSLHPSWTPDQVRDAILAGCDDIDVLNPGFEGKLGAGRINVARIMGVPLAPRPPRDVTAEDTPGDEGGSITIQWLASLDDGAGGNTVTEYIVRRRRKPTGTFNEVGRVPAGTTEFNDTTVKDGVDYYYRVVATDGALESEFETIGPVQSLNDNPPPPVTGTQAFDTPNDNGGSITVTWDAYAPPADFDHFAIYRSTTQFSSLGQMTPLAAVDDAGATSFIDTTVV
ncbi:MAG: S8 family serine peptidase, partial [Armatimonadetes bacterium]|nr:S8 family serine peptidase [Armatimonadota bacterium]